MTRSGRIHRGFTLVEAIATMSVISVVAGVGATLVYSSVQANRDTSLRGQLHEEASSGLEAMCAAIRGVPLRSGPAPDIITVTPSSMTWGGGGALTLTGTTVYLTWPGGTAAELVRNVSVLSIQCYDESNTALGTSLSGAACDAIRRVEILLTVAREGVTETVRTRVFLRSTQTGMEPL